MGSCGCFGSSGNGHGLNGTWEHAPSQGQWIYSCLGIRATCKKCTCRWWAQGSFYIIEGPGFPHLSCLSQACRSILIMIRTMQLCRGIHIGRFSLYLYIT